MFFFIAGVQPRTVTVDENVVPCPACGLRQARLKRTDHYISIFFLPVIRIKSGDPFLVCAVCGYAGETAPQEQNRVIDHTVNTCGNCGRPLEYGFRFCPFCGKRQNKPGNRHHYS